jgi:hypothetical protein
MTWVGQRLLEPRQQWRPSGITATAYTLVLVIIGWVFRITDLGSALASLRAMLFLGHGTLVHFPLSYYPAPAIACYLAIGIIVALLAAGRLRIN